MKSISANLENHLAGEVTTLATCWKITRSDTTIMGFTDHDRDLIIDSVSYLAATGFTPTAIASSDNLAVDNLDVEGMLDSTAIKEEDIMAGLYDFAEIEIFQVNYGNIGHGKLMLRRGWLGEVSIGKNSFVAEVRGLTQRLSRTIGELYSPSCRANFGDSRCGVNLTSFTVTGSITSVTNNQVFADTTRAEASGYFNFGKITFTSGNNNGLSMEVKEYTIGKITLVLPMPYTVQVGNSYSLIAGCDKTFATCRDDFNNVVNFRGEPHVPGTDKMLETSSTRAFSI